MLWDAGAAGGCAAAAGWAAAAAVVCATVAPVVAVWAGDFLQNACASARQMRMDRRSRSVMCRSLVGSPLIRKTGGQ